MHQDTLPSVHSGEITLPVQAGMASASKTMASEQYRLAREVGENIAAINQDDEINLSRERIVERLIGKVAQRLTGYAVGGLMAMGVLTASSGAFAATQSFTNPGPQTWTVPAGITSITVTATGGGGGGGYNAVGGKGGVVTSTLAVAPGDVLTLFVGGGGGGTSSGGGGGGGSTNINAGTSNQIIAGGGGGGGGGPISGSFGGNGNGGNGGNGSGATTGGSGGSGGIGGAYGVSTCCTAGTNAGGNGNGGAGGVGGHSGGTAGVGSGTGTGGSGPVGNGYVGAGGGGYGGGGNGGTGGDDAGGGGGGSTGPVGTVYTLATNAGANQAAGGSGSITIVYAVSAVSAISPTTQSISGAAGTAIMPTATLTPSNFTGMVSYAISPSLPAGLTLDISTGVISGTPTVALIATSYAITGTGSTSGLATTAVSITVVLGKATLAQAIDASVKGTIAGQASAAARLAEAQMRNVTDHINQLGSGLGLQSNRLAIGLIAPQLAQLDQLRPALFAIANAYAPRDVETMHSDSDMPRKESSYLMTADAPQSASKRSTADIPVATGLSIADSKGPSYAFWAAGNVTYGRMSVSTSSNEFHTDGVTFGIDYQLSAQAVVGAAIGYGSDYTDVDALGTTIKGRQIALSAYGVFEPQKGWLLDGQLGYGDLAFDNQRYSSLSRTVFSAQRKGTSTYVAFGLSKPMVVNEFKVKPYVRANFLETNFDAYSEGSDINALAYQSSKIFSSALIVGVSASYDFAQADGAKWTPNAKFELRRNADGSVNQMISFADTPADTATLSLATIPKELQSLGLGISYTQKNGVRLGLNWLGSVGSDAYRSSGMRADFVVPF